MPARRYRNTGPQADCWRRQTSPRLGKRSAGSRCCSPRQRSVFGRRRPASRTGSRRLVNYCTW